MLPGADLHGIAGQFSQNLVDAFNTWLARIACDACHPTEPRNTVLSRNFSERQQYKISFRNARVWQSKRRRVHKFIGHCEQIEVQDARPPAIFASNAAGRHLQAKQLLKQGIRRQARQQSDDRIDEIRLLGRPERG